MFEAQPTLAINVADMLLMLDDVNDCPVRSILRLFDSLMGAHSASPVGV